VIHEHCESKDMNGMIIPGLILCVGCLNAQTNAVSQPDADTIVLRGQSITFRRIQPSRYGTNAPAFFLMETEVTNEMYKRYLDATGRKKDDEETRRLFAAPMDAPFGAIYNVHNKALCWSGNQFPEGRGEHPVALLNVPQATEFCMWLTKKYGNLGTFRLPTKTEWLIAAYGRGRRYPWGDQPDLRRFKKAPWENRDEIFWYDRKTGQRGDMRRESPAYSSESVTARPAGRTPEGLFGIWGNVSELVIPDIRLENKAMMGMGAKWMGGGFGDEENEPGQDYWGYTHGPDIRCETLGFRVLLDPDDTDHKYQHNLGPNAKYGASVYGPIKQDSHNNGVEPNDASAP
jgi:hypothetical protein